MRELIDDLLQRLDRQVKTLAEVRKDGDWGEFLAKLEAFVAAQDARGGEGLETRLIIAAAALLPVKAKEANSGATR